MSAQELQELMLWRWSTAVQLTSLLMIALFFTVLGRSIRTAALASWVRAWQCNFAALAVTLSFWLFQPPRAVSRFIVTPLYMTLKMAFVVLLIQGAWTMRRPGAPLATPRQLAAGLLGYALAATLFVRSLDQIGVVQHTLMFLLLAGAGTALVVRFQPGLGWLGIGFLARGVLAGVEAAAYFLQLAPGSAPARVSEAAATFRSAASSFDSATEWLLALGCVLAVSEWVQRELLRANAELLIAQEDVRKLADRDPLTGLSNRRALPEVFRAVQPGGATLLFFDLDEFKKINDRHGHAAGDEALRRFATALRESFRPSDALVRYSGDEFLVVAAGLDGSAAEDRLQALRARLRRVPVAGTPIAFSVGVAEMPPGGQPDAALGRADEAMYEAKRRRRPGVARLA
jgi:diguanylate cyclase (GGDEF)-like protein